MNEEKQTFTALVSRNSLCRRLERGPEVRAKFVESHISKGIAYQLRAMRESRSWSQQQLATAVGMPQTAISRLESSTYGKPTITTLKRIARVYDVALEVRFVPFSKFVNRISSTPYVEYGLSSDALDVANFKEEFENGYFVATTDAPEIVVPKKPGRVECKAYSSPFELAEGMKGSKKREEYSRAELKAQVGHQPPATNERSFQMAAGGD